MMFFKYSRKDKTQKKDEQGNPIPITKDVVTEDGTVTKENTGEFETEEVIYKDSFNVEKVIRTHTLSPTSIIVLLDDGHEVTQKTPKLRNPNKKGPIKQSDVIEEKERVWVQSEIVLMGEDVERFQAILDVYDPMIKADVF